MFHRVSLFWADEEGLVTLEWVALAAAVIVLAIGVIVVIQTQVVGPVTRALGDRRTLVVGLGCATTGLAVGSLAASIPVFVLGLIPTALGMGLCNPTLTALISRSVGPTEQGLVQGAAGALESLGRTGGPIWGNVVLEHYGEGTTYGAAAVAFAATLALAAGSRPTER
jgi:DHA1 family tetracycline resistance protein-like MFS transporter